MSDYGIKIAETGENILTATDDKMAYTSKFSGWKILAQGTFSISAPTKSTNYTTTISRLTSGGIALAWIENNAGNGNKWIMPHANGAVSVSQMRIKSTSLDLIINVGGAGDTGTYNGYYYWIARS